jgi:phage/plasmid primase-like uncharacterized protein
MIGENAKRFNPANARREFLDAMARRGLELSAMKNLEADGRYHRCDVADKKGGNRDGSYVFSLTPIPHGAFNNWTDERGYESWCAQYGKRELTAAERREIDEEIAKARRQDQKARARANAEARIRAKSMWGKALTAPDNHPYCQRKGVKPSRLKIFRFKDGGQPLLIPMYAEGKLWNLQFIRDDGDKHGLKGGRVTGCHFWICKPTETDSKVIVICEGWATGEDIYQATGHAVIMTFGTSNLLAVAEWVREQYPDRELIIAADDDPPGISTATEVACAVHARLAVPKFDEGRGEKDTDFNDLARLYGHETVREDIADAVEPEEDPEQAGDEEADEAQSEKQADILIVLASNAELFHTDIKSYADIPVEGHRETWSLRSQGFKDWLLHRFYRQEDTSPSSAAMRQAIDTIVAKARFEGPRRDVHLRIGGQNGKIYLDLCNADWQVVEIDKAGWRVVTDAPVRFIRAPGMLPLPTPCKGGSIKQLREFVNLPRPKRRKDGSVKEEPSFVLLIAFMVAALRDRGPYPGLGIMGQEGSAKSTLAKVIIRLIDPRKPEERRPPREDRDLFIAASHNHLIGFGNMSWIPDWLSDSLCSLATGGGFATRTLYTDEDETIFDDVRPMILNGIEFATRSDLADRLIFAKLEKMKEDEIRPEREFWAAFERKRPLILGALLDLVSHGLKMLPNVQEQYYPRMADFAQWATAVETAVWKAGTFRAAMPTIVLPPTSM